MNFPLLKSEEMLALFRINTSTLVLISISETMDALIGQAASIMKLPLYLDSIGTILIAVLLGPGAGALSGFLGILPHSLLNPMAVLFFPVSVVLGFLVGLIAKWGGFNSAIGGIFSGMFVGIVCTFIGVPIVFWVFGGVVGSGVDLVTASLVAFGNTIMTSAFYSALPANIVDKALSCLIVVSILKQMSPRLRGYYLHKSGSEHL